MHAQVCQLLNAVALLETHPMAHRAPHHRQLAALLAAVELRPDWAADVVADLLPQPKIVPSLPHHTLAPPRQHHAQPDTDTSPPLRCLDDVTEDDYPDSDSASTADDGATRASAAGSQCPAALKARVRLLLPQEVRVALWALLHLTIPVRRDWLRLLLTSAARYATSLPPCSLTATFQVIADYR
jgi:hypothetical protein